MKAIFFDVDDTLYDQTQPFGEACRQMYGGAYDSQAEKLFVASRRRSDEVFELSQSCKITMDAMRIYRTQKAFEDCGISISEEEALAFEKHYNENLKHISLPETMREILDFCAEKGIEAGVITNGPSAHQWEKVERLGLLKWIPRERVFVSGDLGASKPDPEIFRMIEQRIGLEPEELWFVGDSYVNDVAGAKRAGWKSLWFNRRGHKIPEMDFQPDLQAASERELLEAVKSLYFGQVSGEPRERNGRYSQKRE